MNSQQTPPIVVFIALTAIPEFHFPQIFQESEHKILCVLADGAVGST